MPGRCDPEAQIQPAGAPDAVLETQGRAGDPRRCKLGTPQSLVDAGGLGVFFLEATQFWLAFTGKQKQHQHFGLKGIHTQFWVNVGGFFLGRCCWMLAVFFWASAIVDAFR